MLGRLIHSSECKHVSARLWDYRTGDLTGSEAERVQTHLALCKSCSAELRFVEQATAAAGMLSGRTPEPRRGWEEIRESLIREAPRPVGWWVRPTALALGAAAVLAAVLLWPKTGVRSPVSRPPLVVRNEHSSIPAPLVGHDHSFERSVAPSVNAASPPVRRKSSAFARVEPPHTTGRRGERRMAWHMEPYPAEVAAAGPIGAPVSIQRSSEMELAGSTVPPKLVTGSMPVSSEELVVGSAPSGVGEPSVSIEPAFDQEAEP